MNVLTVRGSWEDATLTLDDSPMIAHVRRALAKVAVKVGDTEWTIPADRIDTVHYLLRASR